MVEEFLQKEDLLSRVWRRSMSSQIKKLVSKKRRRFQEDGYDLDLTYIIDNLIAMGYPGDKLEGLYRNNITDVIKFLESKHKDHYKIYNLCEERTYNANKFKTGTVAKYPFEDHNPPQLELIPNFCHDVHNWLCQNPQNVACVHCKAGKGRTGVMICCYLLHSGKCQTARAALEFYAQKRTHDKKGVTIPSQQRYVGYYEYLLRNSPDVKYKQRPVKLSTIRLEGHLLEHSKVILQITITSPSEIVYSSSAFEWKNCAGKKSTASTSSSSTDSHLHQPVQENSSNSSTMSTSCGYPSNHLSIELEEPLLLSGDVKLEILSRPVKLLKKTKLCHCWFNTFFVDAPQINLEQLGYRNGCNNGSSDDGSANSVANDHSNSNNSNNGSCSVNKDSAATTVTPQIVSLPVSCAADISKRDSVSSDNCCSVKVRFTKVDPEKMAQRNAKHIDRTMSCPPPSDTVRPRLPEEWTTYNREPPLKPPDDLEEAPDLSRTPNNSPKQHYTMIFSKSGLDKAHKDKGHKIFSSDFEVHLMFTDAPTSDLTSSSSSHASRSSYGGGSSSCSTTSASNQQTQVCVQKLNKMYIDHHPHHHHQHQPHHHDRQFVGGGGLLKTTRTTSDVRAQFSSCLGADDDRDTDDDYAFGQEEPPRCHKCHHHHHHHHRHHNSGGSSGSGGQGAASGGESGGGGGGGGVRLNRNHSSTSSCSSTSSSSSCSENNSSCSNSSSTENCSQLLHNNNKK